MVMPTCSNQFAEMLGLRLVDEPFGPPQFADGGTLAHLAASTPVVGVVYLVVPAVHTLQRRQGGTARAGAFVGSNNGAVILPAAHGTHR